jgi:multicomponent K+:H+ antiporter subunit E
MRRIIPHPLLSLTLTIVWLLLLNDFSIGGLVFGALLGIAFAAFTSSFWPDRLRVRNLPAAVAYVFIVLWDIVVANVQVALIVLSKRNRDMRPAFVTVPLDIRAPEAITILAGTITMTPGTVSADLSADGRAILVHCLDTADAEATARDIKARYETRLKEIFG